MRTQNHSDPLPNNRGDRRGQNYDKRTVLRRPNEMSALRALVVLCAVLAVQAQTCLPGQQPCVNTCCDTNANFTCCPYNGGYCADPTQQCCEGAQGGLCPKTSECCMYGCADSKHECCQASVCDKGECCKGYYEQDWFCLANSQQQCCQGGNFPSSPSLDIWPTAFSCGGDQGCCSVLTSRQCVVGQGNFPAAAQQDALNGCCDPGHVCCPSAQLVSSPDGQSAARLRMDAVPYTSTACGTIEATPPLEFPKRKAATNVTPCADPARDFCCGGMACPTETLCCPGDGTVYGDGCCFGYASETYSCQDSRNSTCPTSGTAARRRP